VKRWQKFCSEKCAGPANRESKRKWWQEHGKQRAS
jgi:predicted nucleic acid-binding Zn ribbon protein